MSEESTPPVHTLFSFGHPNGSSAVRATQTESDSSEGSVLEGTGDEAVDSHESTVVGPDTNVDSGGPDRGDGDSRGQERTMAQDENGHDSPVEAEQRTSRDAPEFQEWCEDVRSALAEADSASVDVYVRSMLPSPGAKKAQMAVLDNISSLCAETVIEDSTVHVWGERICLCDSCRESDTGALMIDTVRKLENWGRAYDASTEPFFERTRQQSSVVDASYEGIIPPRVTAVLYVDSSLQGVFPSTFGDAPYSVSDFNRAVRSMSESGTDSNEREPGDYSDAAEPTQ